MIFKYISSIYIYACILSYKYQNLSHLPLYILVCITNKSFFTLISARFSLGERLPLPQCRGKRPRRFVRSKLAEHSFWTRQLLVGHEWQLTTCSRETNCGGMLWTRCKISNGWIQKIWKQLPRFWKREFSAVYIFVYPKVTFRLVTSMFCSLRNRKFLVSF